MRNALTIPLTQDESLVVTSDNSGAIGMKEQDIVKVAYEVVGYYSFRVAAMECMAAGAIPISIIIQNFCGNDSWEELVRGVQKGLEEIQMVDVPITGSTESNFSLSQSAVGLNVIGRKLHQDEMIWKDFTVVEVGLIGLPLVGEEVVSRADDIAPLRIFKEICELRDVDVWPVGSKGVLYELERLFPEVDKELLPAGLDVLKSGGPATSFLVFYMVDRENVIRDIAGKHFRPIMTWNE